MNILFVYYDAMVGGEGKYNEGIASIAAVLKKEGHNVKLCHILDHLSIEGFLDLYGKKYSDSDLIAFSISELTFRYCRDYAGALKQRYKIPIICGGQFPTLCPDDAIDSGVFDIICRGEGEYPMRELCSKYESGASIDDIENLWIRKENEIIKNPIRPLIEDLSLLPPPDQDVFDTEALVDFRSGHLPVMAARGCPYSCSYCCNQAFRELYPNKSRYVRHKAVPQLISEIKHRLAKCKGIKALRFYDDLLISNKKWFREFAKAYIEQIDLPYNCNCRFEMLDDEILQLLSESGCYGIQVGVETGDEDIRKDILHRNQSNQMIEESTRKCRQWGIKFHTYTIIGIPTENPAHALATVKFVARIQASSSQVSVMYPFKNTAIYDECYKRGLLSGQQIDSYADSNSMLNLPDFSRKQIHQAYQNYHPYFQIYRRLYRKPGIMLKCLEPILDFLWFHFQLSMGIRLLYSITRKIKK